MEKFGGFETKEKYENIIRSSFGRGKPLRTLTALRHTGPIQH